MVICELVAELYPESAQLPADPVARARMRLFIALVEGTLLDAFRNRILGTAPPADFLAVLEALQARLAPEGYVLGEEWSLADVAVAPLLLRAVMMLKYELGKYPIGEGKAMLEALKEPKFARLMKYVELLQARPSVQKTWDEVSASATL